MFTTHFLSSPENQAKIRAAHEASQHKEALAKARQEAFKKVLAEEKETKKKKKNHLQSRYCKSETTTNGSKRGGRGRGSGRGRGRSYIDAPKL